MLENIKLSFDNADESLENNFRPFIGGDGQELRSSYKKGVANRKKKGALLVSLYNCDDYHILDTYMVRQKNNECHAFMAMLNRGGIPDDAIFFADAINARKDLMSFLKERNIDWIFAVRITWATKLLLKLVKVFLKMTPQIQNNIRSITMIV